MSKTAKVAPLPQIKDDKELLKIKLEKAKLEETMAKYRESHKIMFFEPFPHQQEAIDFVQEGKKTVLVQGANRIGKEQPIDARVFVPNGVTQIGKLQIGDDIFGHDGQIYKVDNIFPQGRKPIYKVTFDDGSYTECGMEHLWTVRTPSKRFHKDTRQGNLSPTFEEWQTYTLRQIVDQFGWSPNPGQRCAIPMTEPVDFIEGEELLIKPYTMGVLIGDGGLTTACKISCHSNDVEIIERVRTELPNNHSISKQPNTDYDYTIIGEHQKNTVLNEIRRLKLNVTSHFKFVPNEYLFRPVQDRIDLLRGLMDTDGSIYGAAVMEFASMSKQLAQDVRWLVQSLGGKAKLKEKSFIYNGEPKICYRVMVKLYAINPFYLKRKANLHRSINHRNERLIYKIEFSRYSEAVCIKVTNPDETYLTDEFIVTHNSVICANLAGAFSMGCKLPWGDHSDIFPSDRARTNHGRKVVGKIVCFDHATEVLTKRGWLTRDEITINDIALTINPETLQSEWQTIGGIVDSEGETVHMHGNEMDAVVSMDHRWLIREQTTGGKYKHHIVTTAKLRNGHTIPMTIKPLETSDNPDLSDTYIQLLGWIFTEGTYKNYNRIIIYQSEKANKPKCEKIERLLIDYFGGVKKYSTASGVNQYAINSNDGKDIQAKFPLKKPTYEFIFSMSKRQRQLFYDTLIDGDGTKHKGRDVFYAKDKDFIDMFQVLAVSLGYKTAIGFDGRVGRMNYYIYSSYSPHKYSHIASMQIDPVGIKKVWCISTNNGIIVARRHKNPFVTGNCQDWEKAARDNIVPSLKEWLPVGSYETKKNNVGVEHEFIFPRTGSKFTILTYKEDTKSHEGSTIDWALFDEPPPRDKYIANKRGVISTNGMVMLAMTALDEPWILDEIVLNPDHTTGVVGDIPITANPLLNPEAIRVFEKDLSEDEKVARIQGGWLQLQGRIWKGFKTETHVVEPFKIPPDWPVQFQIDFHLNLPHAIIFYAVDPYNRLFFFNEIWENMGTEDIANEIIRVWTTRVLRMEYGEIDALSKGDTSYIKNRFGKAEDSFTIISRLLAARNIRLGVGSKDEKSYIRAVADHLKGPNGMPTAFIFKDCPEAIKQVQRWSYDDNGQPKSDGHFPECIGRATQTGLKYTPYRRAPLKQEPMQVGAFT